MSRGYWAPTARRQQRPAPSQNSKSGGTCRGEPPPRMWRSRTRARLLLTRPPPLHSSQPVGRAARPHVSRARGSVVVATALPRCSGGGARRDDHRPRGRASPRSRPAPARRGAGQEPARGSSDRRQAHARRAWRFLVREEDDGRVRRPGQLPQVVGRNATACRWGRVPMPHGAWHQQQGPCPAGEGRPVRRNRRPAGHEVRAGVDNLPLGNW